MTTNRGYSLRVAVVIYFGRLEYFVALYKFLTLEVIEKANKSNYILLSMSYTII